MITEDEQLITYVKQAQAADPQALEQLLQILEPRIRAYVYRVTLNHDLTEDLSQESFLEIIRSIGQCKEAEKFMPWAYRIAQSKISQHFRKNGQHLAAMTRHSEQTVHAAAVEHTDTLGQVLQREVAHTLIDAIETMTGLHRAILSLRCYEQYSYADIAATMDCSEVKARILFFRAKKRLESKMKSRGFDTCSLIAGLILFGKLTAPSPAQAAALTVPASCLDVSLTAPLVAKLIAPKAIAAYAALLALLLGLWFSRSVTPPSGPVTRSEIQSLHFTMQSQDPGNGSLSRGAYEQWYYYPEGVDGPHFSRMQRWTPDLSKKLCAWLLNEDGHYYYGCGGPTVYLQNGAWFRSNGDVRCFPHDPVEMSEFLGVTTEDYPGGISFSRNEKTAWLTHVIDRRFPDIGAFESDFQYNQTHKETFVFPWAGVPLVDERDTMHRRGWTYAQITGSLGDVSIQGRARIPFNYRSFKACPPWLEINIGKISTICELGPYSSSKQAPPPAHPCTDGRYWSGMPRPWLGLHTIDLIRRDAARQQLYFSQEVCFDANSAKVVVTQDQDDQAWTLTYDLDIDKDAIRTISVQCNGETKGLLTFTYLQEIDQVGHKFNPPTPNKQSSLSCSDQNIGIQWLFRLASGKTLTPPRKKELNHVQDS